MAYAAFTLALVGVAVGALFRLRTLLAVVGLLLVVSVVFSLVQGFSFLETALAIVVVQTILQGSYFLGLVTKAVFAGEHRVRRVI
jgi:lysylphosphatidylglycerol synthetase-like protein (DUF2156 family)